MSSSDLSDLSSSLSTDGDIAPPPVSKGKLEHYFKHGPSATPTSPPAKKKRPPSPPHEYVLADNENIPVRIIGPAPLAASYCACQSKRRALLTHTMRSSFACSARALATPSPNRCHTMGLRTLKEACLTQYLATKWNGCSVHSSAWFSTEKRTLSKFLAVHGYAFLQHFVQETTG